MKEKDRALANLNYLIKLAFFKKFFGSKEVTMYEHFRAATSFQTTNIWLELYYSILESLGL